MIYPSHPPSYFVLGPGIALPQHTVLGVPGKKVSPYLAHRPPAEVIEQIEEKIKKMAEKTEKAATEKKEEK